MAAAYFAGGAFLSFLGSRISAGKQDKQRKEYDKFLDKKLELDNKSYDFNWHNIQDNYRYAQNTVDNARYNKNLEINWRNKSAIQDWTWKDQTRILNYNNKAKAYNASVEAAGDQMKYNILAGNIARASEDRIAQDKLTAIGFKNEQAIKTFRDAEDIAGLDIASAGRKLKMVGEKRDTAKKGVEVKLEAAAENAEINSLIQQVAFEDKRAEKIVDLQSKNIKSIVATGKIQASGQTGRSTRKRLQSSLANQGFVNSALLDAMERDENQLGISLRQINTSTQNAVKAGKQGYREIYDQVRSDSESLITGQRKHSLNIENAKEGVDFQQRQLKKSVTSLADSYAAKMDQISLEEYGQNLRALNSIVTKPTLQPAAPKPQTLPKPNFLDPRDIYKRAGKKSLADYKGIDGSKWTDDKKGGYLTLTINGKATNYYGKGHPSAQSKHGDILPDVDSKGNLIEDSDGNVMNRPARVAERPIKGHNYMPKGASVLESAAMSIGSAAMSYGSAKLASP